MNSDAPFPLDLYQHVKPFRYRYDWGLCVWFRVSNAGPKYLRTAGTLPLTWRVLRCDL